MSRASNIGAPQAGWVATHTQLHPPQARLSKGRSSAYALPSGPPHSHMQSPRCFMRNTGNREGVSTCASHGMQAARAQ